ncbi:MAG: helix-turn-helix domain-containing protein [Rickettsiales bacterium]|nr:helix-turn-helix domain-containing protein [Rickettsiales bacterium]
MINLHVGQRLRMRRNMLGLSQEAVGSGVGVASQQVQKYEKGTNVMNAIRLYEFAQFLKVPVAYFYEGLDLSGNEVSAQEEEQQEVYGTEFKAATDRETLEVLKSFKRIKDHLLRKRIADMLRALSLKDV